MSLENWRGFLWGEDVGSGVSFEVIANALEWALPQGAAWYSVAYQLYSRLR